MSIPTGHPPLSTFLGIPLISSSEFVGVIGLANSPNGYTEHSIAYLSPIVQACAHIINASKLKRQSVILEQEGCTAERRTEISSGDGDCSDAILLVNSPRKNHLGKCTGGKVVWLFKRRDGWARGRNAYSQGGSRKAGFITK